MQKRDKFGRFVKNEPEEDKVKVLIQATPKRFFKYVVFTVRGPFYIIKPVYCLSLNRAMRLSEKMVKKQQKIMDRLLDREDALRDAGIREA